MDTNNPEQRRPKIIIDEDWKTQVQEEKESLKRQSSEPQATPGSDPTDSGTSSDQPQLPPASFAAHVMSLATQATAALGQLPDPDASDQASPVQLDFAKYLIDTICVLEEKTRGNLTAEEAAMLENVVHQLRLLYVEVSQQAANKS